MLQDNAGCQLPCWWGIQPGETTWQTVLDHFGLQDKPGVSQSDGTTYYEGPVFGVDAEGKVDPELTYVKFDLVERAGIIQTIQATSEALDVPPSPPLAQGWQAYSLDQLLTHYGLPSQVMLEFVPAWGPKTTPYYLLLVLYDNLGIAVRYKGPANTVGPLIQACPISEQVGAISLWLQSPERSVPLLQQAITPAEMPYYRPIGKATGMDIGTFYDTFQYPGSQECLQGEAANLFGIVFSSNRDSYYFSIYRMTSDGRSVERLTSTQEEWGVRVSPTGESVLFGLGHRRWEEDIYRLDIASGAVAQLTDSWGPYNRAMAWSPDGRRVAFISNREAERARLYLMNPDGSDKQYIPLSFDPDGVGYVSWSPDGRHLVCTGGGGPDEFSFLFAVDLTTLEARRLTDETQGFCTFPDWSPDGTWIAMYCAKELAQIDWGEIYIVHPDGSGLRQVTKATDQVAGVREPHWSPDSTEIVYVRNGPQNPWSIYIVGVDGANDRRLSGPDTVDWEISVYRLP